MHHKPTRRDTTLQIDHPSSKSDLDERMTQPQKIPIEAISPTVTPNQRATNPDGGTNTISHSSHLRGARMTNASGRLRRGSLKALVLPQAGHLTLLDGVKNPLGVFVRTCVRRSATMISFAPCPRRLETYGAPLYTQPVLHAVSPPRRRVAATPSQPAAPPAPPFLNTFGFFRRFHQSLIPLIPARPRFPIVSPITPIGSSYGFPTAAWPAAASADAHA